MSTQATVRVMTAEEIAARAGGSTPPLLWPARTTLFAERQMRLRQLAAGHSMQDFLRFAAELARVQQAALAAFPAVPLPDRDALERAEQRGEPPLSAVDWPRDAAWRATLRAMAADLRGTAPAGVQDALARVEQASDDELERQADCLLTGVMQGLDLSIATLVAAALQVYWTHLVCEVERVHGAQALPIGRGPIDGHCPCCGSRPTASITRQSGGASGQRYLHCSLCSLQWHLERIKCTHCGATERVAYQSLAVPGTDDADARAAKSAVQAETCDDCGHYLKIMHSERDPFVEPVADDLATLTLDLLVAEAGHQRHGVNLMLLFGEPDPPDAGEAA